MRSEVEVGRRRRSLLGGKGVQPATAPVVGDATPPDDGSESSPGAAATAEAEPDDASPELPVAGERPTDARDRQNLTDTVAVSAAEAEAALQASAREVVARVDRVDHDAEAGPVVVPSEPVPGGPKATPMSAAALPPTFDGALGDSDWFVRTGQPVPERESGAPSRPGQPPTGRPATPPQTNSAMIVGGAVAVGALGIGVIVVITLAAMFG